MSAFTNRGTTGGAFTSTSAARLSSRDFAADALARYTPPSTAEATIADGDESYTDYVPVKEERGVLARIFRGEPETKMVPVRHTSRAVERSNDMRVIEKNNAELRAQRRREEKALMDFVIERGEATEKLLGVQKRIRHAEFEIELELEQQDSDRATFALKRETDLHAAKAQCLQAAEGVVAAEKRLSVAQFDFADLLDQHDSQRETYATRRVADRTKAETERVKAEQAHADEQTKLEKKRQALFREEGETAKIAARYGRSTQSSTTVEGGRTADEIDALARRATLAAVTGSVAPTSPDRYGFPFAGNLFLAHYMEKKDFDAAREHTYESMYDLFMQANEGRLRLTREKAEREYEHYELLRAEAEKGGAIGALRDFASAFTRGGGKSAFSDEINR